MSLPDGTIAICLNNPNHKQFVATAHVTQEWIIDGKGNFTEESPDGTGETTHAPNEDDVWTCFVCGTEAHFVPTPEQNRKNALEQLDYLKKNCSHGFSQNTLQGSINWLKNLKIDD